MTKRGWINVCKVDGSVQCFEDFVYTTGIIYPTKEEADKAATKSRIACIEIQFEDKA